MKDRKDELSVSKQQAYQAGSCSACHREIIQNYDVVEIKLSSLVARLCLSCSKELVIKLQKIW